MGKIKKKILDIVRPVARPAKHMLQGYPQYKLGNSRKSSSGPRVMVVGRNYSSNLCMARSLGLAGFDVEVMRVYSRRPAKGDILQSMIPDAYSKYVKAFHTCTLSGSTLRGADALIGAADTERKMLLVPTDDISAYIIDESLDRLKANYVMASAGGVQGGLIRLMSKGVQKELAEGCGLPMLGSRVARCENGRYEIPAGVSYPCFIKPDVSCRSSKKRMKRCADEEELRAALDEIALTAEPDLLIEDYAEVKRELSVLGLCMDGKVLCAGMIEAMSGGHGARRGVAATGISITPGKDDPVGPDMMEKIRAFMKATGYEGLFDIDLIETEDGGIYFLELNLRYGASGYAVTCEGIDLPGIFAERMLNGKPVPDEEAVMALRKDPARRLSFASEKVLLENYSDGAITAAEYDEAVRSADVHFVNDEADRRPYEKFMQAFSKVEPKKADADDEKDNFKEKYKEFRKLPLNDKCIVFESLWGRRYSCNPAALYEYIDRNHPEYECVWFLNDTDTPIPGRAKKVKRGTEEHKYYLATAKWFIYNNNMPRSFKKRDGQVIVQTMHGTPFKSFGLDVKEEAETEQQRIRVVERSALWDYLIAQGEFTKNMAWRWFRYDKTVLETGYPRTDSLYAPDEEAAAEVRKTLGLPADKKVILYAPTWREMDRFDMMLDLEEMRRRLSDSHVLLVRLHHFVSEFYEVPEDGEFIFDAGGIEKIEDLFALTDVLITDYSSVMFDFALTGRPMIFFAYDLEEYTGEDRGSYFRIEDEAPGTLAVTTAEVIDAIEGADADDGSSARTEAFMKKYLTYENADSCAKVYDDVFVRELHLSNFSAGDRAWQLAGRVLPGRVYRKLRKAAVKRRAKL